MIDARGRRQRAVPAGAARRVSRSSRTPRRSSRPSPSCSTSWPCRSPTSTPSGCTAKAREHDIYIQSGSMLERDPRWPGVRVQHDVPDRPGGHPLQVPQGEPVDSRTRCTPARTISRATTSRCFPVADTPIGRIGCAICYDWLFPEAIRQLAANGAEVLVRVSAYMDPWGATEPMNWWTIVNRCRALENMRVRRRRQPGREPAALSAVLVAGRQPGRRLRRPPARGGVARARRADRRRADRHHRAAARARDAPRPSHAGAPAHRGVPGLFALRGILPARGRPLSYETKSGTHRGSKSSQPGPCRSLPGDP